MRVNYECYHCTDNCKNKYCSANPMYKKPLPVIKLKKKRKLFEWFVMPFPYNEKDF